MAHHAFPQSTSPVKSQKFLPAVNHTKLRIPMFTPELMEKSTCTLVWKTKVCKLGLLFFPWIIKITKSKENKSIHRRDLSGSTGPGGAAALRLGYHVELTRLIFLWDKHRLKASVWGCCGLNYSSAIPATRFCLSNTSQPTSTLFKFENIARDTLGLACS